MLALRGQGLFFVLVPHTEISLRFEGKTQLVLQRGSFTKRYLPPSPPPGVVRTGSFFPVASGSAQRPARSAKGPLPFVDWACAPARPAKSSPSACPRGPAPRVCPRPSSHWSPLSLLGRAQQLLLPVDPAGCRRAGPSPAPFPSPPPLSPADRLERVDCTCRQFLSRLRATAALVSVPVP